MSWISQPNAHVPPPEDLLPCHVLQIWCESLRRARITARDHRRQGSQNQGSSLVTIECHTTFRAPDKTTLAPFYFDFYTVAYHLDCSKVVLLYNIFNFVTGILGLTSLDHPEFDSKLDPSHCQPRFRTSPRLTASLPGHFSPSSM
jgi:hypothetical protein